MQELQLYFVLGYRDRELKVGVKESKDEKITKDNIHSRLQLLHLI